MPERSLLSRVLRALERLPRRLTIGFGTLILVFYFFGHWILAVCLALSRLFGMAKIEPCKCAGGFCRDHRPWLHPRAHQPAIPDPPATGWEFHRQAPRAFQAKDSPVLHWRGDDRSQVDLGEVISLSPQIEQAGLVHVTFTYSGANPSLD